MNDIFLDNLEREVANLKSYLSFREYILNEAKQVGYLYHFTTLSRIEKIVNSKIKKGNEGYVSLTRDFQLPNENGYFNSGEYIVRIVIDGDMLFNNFKITPIRDIHFNDEREEGILQDIDLKYVKQIDILTSDTRVFSKTAIFSVYKEVKKAFKNTNLVKKFQTLRNN